MLARWLLDVSLQATFFKSLDFQSGRDQLLCPNSPFGKLGASMFGLRWTILVAWGDHGSKHLGVSSRILIDVKWIWEHTFKVF